ncbi:hypothetical protein Acr_00g0049260 [Actinidia rufa]|uniref:Retrotransposon gag domain-containing protein n=1 Tax=Actinidia rufa TaxID=165716 RepID=A0A7J0DKH0_9ERIC|nr:hypothetical protein Acr_00g0049260 [Actinidia rufa]
MPVWYNILLQTILLLPPHLFQKILIDLAVLIDWVTRIRRIVTVLVRDIQLGTIAPISKFALQMRKEVLVCRSRSSSRTKRRGPARLWFKKLSPRTIDSFGDLSNLFVPNFMSGKVRQKNASHRFIVHQKDEESLKDYVRRFNQVVLKVEDPSDEVVIMAMMESLCSSPLFDFLSKNVLETLSSLQSKADNAVEKLAEAKRRRQGKDDHKRKEPNP